MAPHLPNHKAASPSRIFFDPWNSASTGHQRAENRLSGSTAWRDSRSAKLQSQFAAGFASGGGKRMYDSVGAGNENFGEDGRTDTGWDDSVKGWRRRQGIDDEQGDIEAWAKSGGKVGCGKLPKTERKREIKGLDKIEAEVLPKRVKLNIGRPVTASRSRESMSPVDDNLPPPSAQPPRPPSPPNDTANSSPSLAPDELPRRPMAEVASGPSRDESLDSERVPQIFANLAIFINGSTMPLVSDHKLKHLLTNHGARMSIALGRRSVTHVILGKANSGVGQGAGGGLAGSKIEKEVLRRGRSGNGIRYVSVEWALESIKAGKRLAESRFPGVNTAPAGVKSVRNMLLKTTADDKIP